MKEKQWKVAKSWDYELGDGWVARAGKTDQDNDQLSLREARPNQYWFHVKGMPGSHVILVNEDDAEPSSELLKRAAAIAAYHSKARNAGQVAVNYTQAKHVGKPRGAKPGSVTIKREKTLKVRPAI